MQTTYDFLSVKLVLAFGAGELKILNTKKKVMLMNHNKIHFINLHHPNMT
jgi:hypothetical protein